MEMELSGFWFVVGKICWVISVAGPLLLAAFFCFCLLAAAWQGLAAVVKKIVSVVREEKINQKNKKNKKVYRNGKIFTRWGY